MPSRDDTVVTDFLIQVETLPWFTNLGKPMPTSTGYRQVQDWSEWQGPEEYSALQMHVQQQALHDELMREDESVRLKELWDRIHAIVFRVAAPRVPYDAEQDAWHPPSMAVWHAAWTAGLLGLCLYLEYPVPRELRAQWECFASGHWPCDWDGEFPNGQPVVY